MFRVYLALLTCLLAAPGFAQTATTAPASTTNNNAAEKFGAPRTAAPINNNVPAGNNNNATTNGQGQTNNIGCSRGDWLAGKCSVHPSDPDAYPQRHPGQYPVYRRPIIIAPTPAAAPVDDTPLASDWEGCRKTKLNQLNLTDNGNLERAKQLDEWLWKNCRSYSEDLRQLEQDRM